MKEPARTYVIVSVITALIWLVAESEGLRTQQVEFEVRLSGSPTHAVRVAPGESWPGVVEATLRGPSAAIDRLRRRLAGGVELSPGEGLPAGTTRASVALREALRGTEPFVGSGVNLIDSSPREVLVEVVERVPLELDVRVEVEGAETEGAARAVPPVVTLMIPRGAAAGLGEDPAVVARVPASVVSGLPAGSEQRVQRVRVRLPEALSGVWGIAPDPLPTVDVTLTIRDAMASLTLPQVPVQIALPSIEQPRWDISVGEPFIRDVTVRGPREVIDRLRGEGDGVAELRVLAFVWLSFEELERGLGSKEARFAILPPIRQTVSFEAADPEVGLEIRRRE